MDGTNRRRWWVFLLPLAFIRKSNAQDVCTSLSSDPEYCEKERLRHLGVKMASDEPFQRNPSWKYGSVSPDECPVCAERAEPFKSPTGRFCESGATTCYPEDPLSPRIVRCKKCNAAFWQDGEK